MTRPLLAAIVVGVILGGTAIYMQFLDYLRERAASEAAARQVEDIHAAHGVFAVDLTFTAAAEPDPFQSEGKPASVTVVLGGAKGTRILQRTDEIAAGTKIRVSPVEGIKVGENIFYIEVSPATSGDPAPLAVRLQVLKIDEGDRVQMLGENTFWASDGLKATGTLTVKVAGEAMGHEH